MKIILLIGKICVGKSTYARELGGMLISCDQLMQTMFPDGCGEDHDMLAGRARKYLLALARQCGKAGGTACPVMNGANEEAVALFLNDQIGFYDIYRLVNRAVEQVPFIQDPTLEQILESDRLARAAVRQHISGK